MTLPGVTKAVRILLLLVLSVVIIKFGKPFLMPLTFAALLAMLLLPVTKWLERKGVNRVIATLLSILVLVGFFGGLFFLIGSQASGITKNASKVEQQFSQKYQQVQQLISEKLGIPPKKQEEMMKKQQSSVSGKLASAVGGLVAGIGGILANTVLVLVYIFLLIYFRGHLKRFVIRIVPKTDEAKARETLHQCQKVTQKYLGGYALMILGLWIMYGIGFSIAGVKNAIFFAILCGVLEIIPFIGNIVGTSLTLIFALVQGGGTNVVIGILVTYAVVQFIQSYILEPMIVGKEVNINPLFTIVGLIAAEVLWGIGGMVVAIPVMGVAKIIFDHVEPLKPYGELIGEDQKGDSGMGKKLTGAKQKVKNWFS